MTRTLRSVLYTNTSLIVLTPVGKEMQQAKRTHHKPFLLRAPPRSRPRTETVSGRKRARAQNRAPGLELVHDFCVRARSLDTFPLDVERTPDKIPLKKQVPLATIRDRARLLGGALRVL